MPLDTLFIRGNTYARIINKGSRYLAIYLPQGQAVIESAIKTAKKQHAKAPAVYKIKIASDSNIVRDFFDSEFVPRFPGGVDKFNKLLITKLVYPDAAINNNIEGTVEISFSVLKDGRLANIKILRGLGFGCDEALIKAMEEMPKWIPGLTNGRPFEAQIIFDVEFKLTD